MCILSYSGVIMGQCRLEHVEEVAHKAKLKLAKISAELKALNAEIKSLQTEYSTSLENSADLS